MSEARIFYHIMQIFTTESIIFYAQAEAFKHLLITQNTFRWLQIFKTMQAHLWQIHSSESIDRHRKFSQKAVHLARHTAALSTEDDYFIGLG